MVSISSELVPFISASPARFAPQKRGATLTLSLVVRVAPSTLPRSIAGTITLRKPKEDCKRNEKADLARALPVAITVVDPGGCGGPGPLTVKAVSGGWLFTCAVLASGAVRCWGRNDSGQLGDGTQTDRPKPDRSDVLQGAEQIASGGAHACALLATGAVRCWGANASLELGDDPSQPYVYRRLVPGDEILQDMRSTEAGMDFSCAVRTNSLLRCWGSNAWGKLGSGNDWSNATPVEPVLEGVRTVAAADDHTCALLEAGGVRCWGYNYAGQLGDGSTMPRFSPPAVDILTPAVAISTGGATSCAVIANGESYCWGALAPPQGEVGALAPSGTPIRVPLDGVREIAVGNTAACALRENGGVRCWGSNMFGQLGDGDNVDRTLPGASDILDNVRSISGGGFHFCAILTSGALRCWGRNDNGQLGDGTMVDRNAPVEVGPFCPPLTP
jgi:alpha-tubulin suppressor-like RCC1 family protein